MELAHCYQPIRWRWRNDDFVLPVGMARGRKLPYTLSSDKETDRVDEHYPKLFPICYQFRWIQLRPHLLPGCQGRRPYDERYLHPTFNPDAIGVLNYRWRSW